MDRVIKDGKVAVLVSPGWGAGFYTWNSIPNLCFCPYIVNHILNGTESQIQESEIKKIYGLTENDYLSTSGLEDVEIVWVEQGASFTINEYDGNESIQYLSDISITA